MRLNKNSTNNFCASSRPLPKFEITNHQLWSKRVSENTDSYGRAVIENAADWAQRMEKALAQGYKLEKIAKSTMAYTNVGMTGFMPGFVVDTLAEVWRHGESLKKWFYSL